MFPSLLDYFPLCNPSFHHTFAARSWALAPPLPCAFRHAISCSLRRLFTLSHPDLTCPPLPQPLAVHLTFLCPTLFLRAAFVVCCGRAVSLRPSPTHIRLSAGPGEGVLGEFLPECERASGWRKPAYVSPRHVQVFTVSASPIACWGLCFSRGKVLAARAGLCSCLTHSHKLLSPSIHDDTFSLLIESSETTKVQT